MHFCRPKQVTVAIQDETKMWFGRWIHDVPAQIHCKFYNVKKVAWCTYTLTVWLLTKP